MAKSAKGRGGGGPSFPIPAKFYVALRESGLPVSFMDEAGAMVPLVGFGQSQYGPVVAKARDIGAGLKETLRVVEYVFPPKGNITTIPPGVPRSDLRIVDTTPPQVHD